MGNLHRLRPVAVAFLLAVLLSACAGTRRPPFFGRRHKPVDGVSPALKVATRDELNAIIARTYDAIQSFQATGVDLTTSKGSVYQGTIVDFPAASGFILFRKPNDIHIHATFLSALVFDMVSNGNDFRLYLPKNTPSLFVEGLNSAPAASANKMENLRPDSFLSSILIRPWDPATESIMLKDDTDEEDALYRLEFNGKGQDGMPIPGREIWFDRLDLTIVRQKVYDKDGLIVSDTSYSKWQPFGGVLFPTHIDLNRVKDGYGVQIDIDKDKMVMNKELADPQFVLERPEGSTLREIR